MVVLKHRVQGCTWRSRGLPQKRRSVGRRRLLAGSIESGVVVTVNWIGRGWSGCCYGWRTDRICRL